LQQDTIERRATITAVLEDRLPAHRDRGGRRTSAEGLTEFEVDHGRACRYAAERGPAIDADGVARPFHVPRRLTSLVTRVPAVAQRWA